MEKKSPSTQPPFKLDQQSTVGEVDTTDSPDVIEIDIAVSNVANLVVTSSVRYRTSRSGNFDA
jgi:hypothetical protein